MSDKVLDASKETQKLTTQSKFNDLDYTTKKVLLTNIESFSFDNILTDDIELCLNKTKTNNE